MIWDSGPTCRLNPLLIAKQATQWKQNQIHWELIDAAKF